MHLFLFIAFHGSIICSDKLISDSCINFLINMLCEVKFSHGEHIIVKIDDKTVVDYIETNDFKPAPGQTDHFLSSGTFALQGHNPNSEVHFKNIMVKVPD